jgi:hypothetical protein
MSVQSVTLAEVDTRWNLPARGPVAIVVCQKCVNAVVAVVAEVDSSGRVSVRSRLLRLVRGLDGKRFISLCEWSGMSTGAGWMVEDQSGRRNAWTGTILDGPKAPKR